MKKALIIATIYPFINGFEKNNVRLLKELGYEVHTISSGNDKTANLDEIGVIKNVIPITRNPFSLTNIKAYFFIKEYIEKNSISLVHCHTPVGGVLGRLCNRKRRKEGKSKTIYTAHGFHFYKGAPLLNWCIYYPIEKILSKYTDVLITINYEDYEFSLKNLHAKFIYKINGIGINIDKIKSIKINKNVKKNVLGVSEKDYIIMSVGELNKNKNHINVIRALENIDENITYIICGIGNMADFLQEEAKKRHVNLKLLGYRNDVFELLKIADLFVFPSYREGLPVSLLEAIAAEVTCISSDIRGCRDLLENKYLFDPDDIEKLSKKILFYLKNVDDNIYDLQNYSIEKVSKTMKEIYSKINSDFFSIKKGGKE